MGTDFTPTHNIAHPDGQYAVDPEGYLAQMAGSIDSALTSAIGTANNYTNQVKWDRANPVDGGVNFNTLTAPGFRWVNSTTGSTNAPPVGSGALEIFLSSNALQVIQRITYTLAGGDAVWQRAGNLSSGAWSEWRRTDSEGTWYKGVIPNNVDYNDYQTPGWYFINAASGSTNAPPVGNGALEVFPNPNGLQIIQRFTATVSAAATTYTRAGNLSTGVWSEWAEVGGGSSGGGDASGALRQTMLRDTFAGRRGGTIGANGRAVVALRFDHHLTHFESKVLPLLRQHNLPWSQIMNADTWGNPDNSGMTKAELQAAALSSGGEVWNHGGNHLDATGQAAIYDQIVGSLERLTADLPELPIEGWAPPGLGEGGYDGHTPANTIERHTDTYAGQLVLSHHGVVAGYMPGIYRTLDGGNRIGLAHTTIDASTPANVSSVINGAVAVGAGLALMLHSNYLDTAGYLTTAQLGAIFADIAARRDAGEIMVTTYSGLWLADARSNLRHNLLPTVAATTGTYSQSVALNRQPQYAGGTREFVADIASTAGATMTVTINGAATNHVVPAGGGTIRRFVTLPLTSTSAAVDIVRTSGAQHTTSNVRLLAA